MVIRGQKRSEVVKSGQKRSELVKSGLKWSEEALSGQGPLRREFILATKNSVESQIKIFQNGMINLHNIKKCPKIKDV